MLYCIYKVSPPLPNFIKKGNYELRELDENGQRIRIPIEIKTPTKTYSILTGWMIHPNGHIQLTTPFTGKNI